MLRVHLLLAVTVFAIVILLSLPSLATPSTLSDSPITAHSSTRDGQLHLSLSHGRNTYRISLSGLSPHTLLSTELIFTISEQQNPTVVLTIPVNAGPAHSHDDDSGDPSGDSVKAAAALQFIAVRNEWSELDDPIWRPPSIAATQHTTGDRTSSKQRDIDEDEEEDEDGDEDEEGNESAAFSLRSDDYSAPSPLSAPSTGRSSHVKFPSYPAGVQPLLALVMIVKNEAAGMQATLDSTYGFIDHYSLLDTGSTDGTLDIIRAFYSTLPPTVTADLYQEPFVDFSTTRNRALQLTGTRAEFVLMMNGDDRLVGGDEMRRFLETRRGMTAMDEAIYIIPIDYGGMAVGRSERLARSANHFVPGWPNDSYNHWRFEGVTHEAYVCNKALQSGAQIIYTTGDFRIYHDISQDTPDKKNARFELDIQLLKQELADHPDAYNTARNIYYLAQSYYNLDRWDEAAYWYEQRVNTNYIRPTPWGEDNEKHRAYSLLAHIAEKQGNGWKIVEGYWKKSWEACPAAFSLFSLAKSMRDRGELDEARKMAEKCRTLLSKGSPVVCNGDDVLTQKQLPALMQSLKLRQSAAKAR